MILYGIIAFYALCTIYIIYEIHNAPFIEDDFLND